MTIMVKVESSNIEEVGHLGTTLTVTFKSGATWDYFEVPFGVYDEMLKAESVGKFFNQHIKSKYEGKKREEPKS